MKAELSKPFQKAKLIIRQALISFVGLIAANQTPTTNKLIADAGLIKTKIAEAIHHSFHAIS